MSNEPPSLIAINHDDYHATHIGRTSDGRQFFLTKPFVPLGNEFISLYFFDEQGKLLEAHIDNLGTRDELDLEHAKQLFQQRIQELGEVQYGRIEIQPFEIERFGTTFGLVLEAPEAEDEIWWATVEPGDYMAFSEPWDSGEYDT